MAKQEFGNCPACNQRFPLRAGRLPTHLAAGTRSPCTRPNALPVTEYPKVDALRPWHKRRHG